MWRTSASHEPLEEGNWVKRTYIWIDQVTSLTPEIQSTDDWEGNGAGKGTDTKTRALVPTWQDIEVQETIKRKALNPSTSDLASLLDPCFKSASQLKNLMH